MAHPLVETMVGALAAGRKDPASNLRYCDFEGCPGHSKRATARRLIYHCKYLFVHPACVPGARAAARERGEIFGFRRGL